MPTKPKQNARFDWLADAAEAYVAYCFSRDGFEVFGAGKWEADLIVRHQKLEDKKWLRVEVKSGPVRRWKRFIKKADLYAEVRFKDEDRTTTFGLYKLNPKARTWKEAKGKRTEIKQNGDIKKFFRNMD